MTKLRAALFRASSAAVVMLTGTQPAHAAEAGAVDELIITGTRAEGRSRVESLAPVDVVSAAAVANQGTMELATALARVVPSISFPRPSIADGTDSVRPATLRGLAPDQTLVLVNGFRRHVSALVNVNGSIGRGSAAVDLNAVPTVALQSIEVLRDGAAAQYGSDAIAGVINLRLREAREGGAATLYYGVYDTHTRTARDPASRHRRDGPTYGASGWQGIALGAEGFLTVSAEYRYRNPTSRGDLDPRITPRRVNSRYGDPQSEEHSIYANAGLPLGDDWSLYSFAGYQKRRTDSAANPRLAGTAANVAAIFPGGFLPLITTNIDDYTLAVGAKGSLGDFKVRTGLVYGADDLHYGVIDTVNASLGAASPTRFDAGSMKYGQWVATADITRDLSIGLLQPASLAFGAEYRHEAYEIGAGGEASYVFGGIPGTAAGAQGFPGFKPSNEVDRARHSESAYVDFDARLTPRLGVNIAGRYEHYSDFGSTTNGKVSARFEATDALALRATVSTGFRAPALQQQYFTATSTNFIPINGVNTPVEVGTFPSVSPVAVALGGKPLKAETSVNYSAGLVFRRGALEITIDAYRIELDDRIVLSENIQGSPTGSATARAIFNLINPPGAGAGLGAARFFINGVDTRTEGLDAVGRYRWDGGSFGRLDVTAAANFNRTKVTRIPTTPVLSGLPVPPILFDRANRLIFERGTPRQKFVVTTDWSRGSLSATAKATYYGNVVEPNNNPGLDYNVGARTLVDLEGRWTSRDGTSVALGVDNLFDKYPNPTPTNVNTNGPLGFSRFSPYGFNGRFVYARLGYAW